MPFSGPRARDRLASVLAIVVGTAAGLGWWSSDDGEKRASGKSEPASTQAPTSAQCKRAKKPLLAAINGGMQGGARFKKAYFVKSDDFKKAYFVSGVLSGTGQGIDNVATFVTNSPSGGGLINAVGSFAHQFSDYGAGEKTNARFSQTDDGYSASQDCARG
jgi:hypothetical protein